MRLPSSKNGSSRNGTNGSSRDGWIRPSKVYEVPDITLNDPVNRPLRVVVLGAGVSGIMLAYKIQNECKNVDFVVYEKNAGVGGTWFENRYPGCACDVPSHAYSLPFAPNPDWPKYLSPAADIRKYLDKVVNKLDLEKDIRLNHQCAGAWWDEERGKWKLKIQIVKPKQDWSNPAPPEVVSELWDECDVLFQATGILNRWDYPKIPGLNNFEGRIVHTAGWPDNYGSEQWKGQKVVVIGSGASSLQTVSTMQPHVKHMDIYVRTPVWIVDAFGGKPESEIYTKEQMETFRKDPKKLIEHITSLESFFNSRFSHNIKNSPEQLALTELTKKRMAEFIKDENILKGITPDFPVNCRRMTPSDPYMIAIQQPNVTMHFCAVEQITKKGVIGGDGVEVPCDTIVCATGFDVSFRPRFPVVGRNGVNLQDKWQDAAEGYFGLACPDMPNWLTFLGPNWPVAAGSVICGLDANTTYAIKCIKKMQNELIKSFSPTQESADAFNEHTQTWAQKMVWTAGCRSWYVDNDTGRLRAVFPGSTMHYRESISEPRWEDMQIDYLNKHNKYAYMGIGRHLCQTEEGKASGVDATPYWKLDRIDPRMQE